MNNKVSEQTSTILNYGKVILDKFNLVSSRKEFIFDFEINHQLDPTLSNPAIIDFITKQLQIPEEKIPNIRIIHKQLPETGLSWHIDDCQFIKRSKPPTYNQECYISLDDKKWLYFNTPTRTLPSFTILFYSSTYDEDFTGGKLILSDGREILPKKGYGIMIDARESHMVSPIHSGSRFVSVVKIY